MEVFDSVFFSLLIMEFEARLEKILKQLELFRFSVDCGHRRQERLWQVGNCVNIRMEICRIVVVCQLLKCQQNVVRFNRRRGIFTAELRLVDRTVLFLLS